MRLRHAACAALLLPAAALAVSPDSYDMPNGNTGTYQYWDDTYSGTGCTACDNASLLGGTGDLTDGVIATDNWFVTEAPSGAGPYVGWAINPTITFRWNSAVEITSVTFHFDDANGNGGVSPPASVTIDGTVFTVADPSGSAPFAFTAGVSFTGTDLTVSIQRSNSWVFLSEVQFNAAPVPEPAGYALMAAGLLAVGAAVNRRKSRG